MKNNLEAVKEVVRQLRLRDIGGIIVIDFIDMANPKNRATVEEALRSELERDRTKTYVVEISPLGLVEMTRQNVTDGPREILTTKCVVCAGDGFVVSEATHALEIERKLREIAKGSRAQAFRIAVHPRVLALLAGPGGTRLQEIEAAARRRFFLVPAAAENGHVHLDHFEVLEQGKLEALKPAAAVEEGASLELKLVEVGLYDPTAGVGKVDGSEVVVAGAAKLVGKKVAVTRRPRARRCRLRDRSRTRPRPRRRSRSRRRPRSRRARRAEGRRSAKEPRRGGAPDESAEEPSSRTEVDAELEAELEVAADASPTRRGVAEGTLPRPARRRRRSARAAERVEDAGARSPRPPRLRRPRSTRRRPRATDGSRRRGSTSRRPISRSRPRARARAGGGAREPAAEATAEVDGTADGQPKRKRSRRGTRGGRKRKKPAANGGTPDEASRDRVETGEVAVASESPRRDGAPPSTSRCPSGSRTSTRARRGR